MKKRRLRLQWVFHGTRVGMVEPRRDSSLRLANSSKKKQTRTFGRVVRAASCGIVVPNCTTRIPTSKSGRLREAGERRALLPVLARPCDPNFFVLSYVLNALSTRILSCERSQYEHNMTQGSPRHGWARPLISASYVHWTSAHV
jgi:hypothetical protein